MQDKCLSNSPKKKNIFSLIENPDTHTHAHDDDDTKTFGISEFNVIMLYKGRGNGESKTFKMWIK